METIFDAFLSFLKIFFYSYFRLGFWIMCENFSWLAKPTCLIFITMGLKNKSYDANEDVEGDATTMETHNI
jgi:hypothetical protein